MKRLPWLALVLLFCSGSRADDAGWVVLFDGKGLDAFQKPTMDWILAGDAKVDPANPRRLVAEPGTGVLINGVKGSTRDLLTKAPFGSVELHLEFLVPQKSNSGVKLHGHYEIQLADSFGAKEPTASDCGGIYPRAELQPRYRHIDRGIPPKVNACKAPGEWQVLDITFLAPRFDAEGKKSANARFEKVVLNGQLIHEKQEIAYPTGHAWKNKEMAAGPILLQADHGPVAFRNVRVRAYEAGKGK